MTGYLQKTPTATNLFCPDLDTDPHIHGFCHLALSYMEGPRATALGRRYLKKKAITAPEELAKIARWLDSTSYSTMRQADRGSANP